MLVSFQRKTRSSPVRRIIRSSPGLYKMKRTAHPIFYNYSNDITCAAFVNKESSILTGHNNGYYITKWNWNGSSEKIVFDHMCVSDTTLTSIIASPDGKMFLSIDANGFGKLGLTDGRKSPLSLDQNGLVTAAFSPRDSTQMITAGKDSTVRLWTIGKEGTMRCKDTLRHKGTVVAVAFSTDEQRILTGSINTHGRGSAILWTRHRNGKWDSLVIIELPRNAVTAVAFSSDFDSLSSRFVIGSNDNLIRWAYTHNPKKLNAVPQRSSVTSVVFSPNGERIATGYDNAEIRIWNPSENVDQPVDGFWQKIWNRLSIGKIKNIKTGPSPVFAMNNCDQNSPVLSLVYCNEKYMLCFYGQKARLLEINEPVVGKGFFENNDVKCDSLPETITSIKNKVH